MPTSQLLLMNSGVHFSTFPVSGASEIKQICETQLTGEVRLLSRALCEALSTVLQNQWAAQDGWHCFLDVSDPSMRA